MFKCTDCGQEFEIKPDYCDCGNNVFEEIITEIKPEKEQKVIEQPVVQQQYKRDTYKSKNKVDLYAIIIFVICIILSICSVIFIGKDSMEKEKQVANSEKTTPVKNNNIPSIDKLWVEGKKTILPSSQPVTKSIQIIEEKQTIPQTKEKTTKGLLRSAHNDNQQIHHPQKTTSNNSSIAKQQTKQPQKIQVKQPVQNKQTQIKTTKLPPQAVQPKTTTVQQKPVITAKNQTNTQKAVINRQELSSYKIGLRNKIAGNIDFTKVIGDGNCIVTFKLDDAGNLINRKFALQSDNDSLNKQVHSAIMNNPTYKSPPVSYRGETLSLSVRMYGGRFSITLN